MWIHHLKKKMLRKRIEFIQSFRSKYLNLGSLHKGEGFILS
jgi:hypothetical protein